MNSLKLLMREDPSFVQWVISVPSGPVLVFLIFLVPYGNWFAIGMALSLAPAIVWGKCIASCQKCVTIDIGKNSAKVYYFLGRGTTVPETKPIPVSGATFLAITWIAFCTYAIPISIKKDGVLVLLAPLVTIAVHVYVTKAYTRFFHKPPAKPKSKTHVLPRLN